MEANDVRAPLSRAGFLDGVVVVEGSATPAAAFAAALAGDFGATVIVCEPPEGGSALRRLGPAAVRRVWWPVLARNKRSLAIDTSLPGAEPVLARLVAGCDLLLRDPCPTGDSLHAALRNPRRAVDVHLFPTGTDMPELWPWSTDPEFAAAASGMMALTGDPGGPATQPEIPLADYCAGMMALSIALAELRSARRTGEAPEPVTMALHEALHRMNEWSVVVASQRGRSEVRNGNRFPMNANIGNIFRSRDGQMLTVSAATPSVADRLLAMIGGAALRDDPRFRTPADRLHNMDALDGVIAAWIGQHNVADVMRLVRDNDVVAGPICNASDLLANPHAAARGDIVRIADGESSLPMPAALPITRPCRGEVRKAGPSLGEDSDEILAAMKFSSDEIATLRQQRVVWR